MFLPQLLLLLSLSSTFVVIGAFTCPTKTFLFKHSYPKVTNSWKTKQKLVSPLTLQMSWSESDPFAILNIPNATTDKKVIKKAYRRMAMKYHPDVVISADSTSDDKKKASDRFAAINAAYEMLMGKNVPPSNSSKEGSKSKNTRPPPHRRSSAYYNTSVNTKNNKKVYSGENLNWEDFMPKTDEDKYDTDGDSFASIFSDFVTGISGIGGGGDNQSGILRDLVEFLEGNIEGFSSGNYNEFDPTMQNLLQYGTQQEIKEELDDTELLVNQLTKKLNDLTGEAQRLHDAIQSNISKSFTERFHLEERLEEVRARKKVVEGYLTKGKARLLRLQTKYKEIRLNSFTNDTYQNIYDNDYSSNESKETPQQSSNNNNNKNNSWQREGFGTSGRGRQRRRSSATRPNPNTTTNTSTKSTSKKNPSSYSQQSSNSTTKQNSAPSSSNTKKAAESLKALENEYKIIPPHRRTPKQTRNAVEENKKRLRELQVEDEFEKLKKELGM